MNIFCKYFLFTCVILGLISCSNDMEVLGRIIDPEEVPDVYATNVEVFYTDSARLQMKMTTPLLRQFAEVKEPRNEFPEGIHVWLYEKTGELKAEITANWANQDQTTNIWEARSNVILTNDKGEKLETEQLFWDQAKAQIYSNKFTKYTDSVGTIATGRNGMRANQDFSKWELLSGGATIMFEDEKTNE